MLIAIDSKNEDLAGAIVYWRLTGDVNGDALNNALINEGLDEHRVSLPTPRRALRRAMQEWAKAEVFLRAGKGKDGATYLVRQSVAQSATEEPEFSVWVKAHLNTVGQPQVEVHDSEDPDTLRAELVERYWHHIFHVAASDISSWLISQARECDAVSLRETGGVYFVPRHAVDEWRRRVDALHGQTSCHVYMVPAMNSEEALDAILQSMIDEAVAFTEQFQSELDGEELGKKALENRAEKAKVFLDKLARYEKLLGGVAEGKLDAIRAEIEEQQANAISAALTIEEDAA